MINLELGFLLGSESKNFDREKKMDIYFEFIQEFEIYF